MLLMMLYGWPLELLGMILQRSQEVMVFLQCYCYRHLHCLR
jgi:hypothetical protein